MTTQIANVARLQGSMAHVYPTSAPHGIEPISGKITGVDSVGVSVLETTDGESRAAEQFFPWTSIGRLVLQ